MKPRYGKTVLIEDFRKHMNASGYNISVRESRILVDSMFDLFLKGLCEYGSISVKEVGTLTIERNSRCTLQSNYLRVKYRATDKVKEALGKIWSKT